MSHHFSIPFYKSTFSLSLANTCLFYSFLTLRNQHGKKYPTILKENQNHCKSDRKIGSNGNKNDDDHINDDNASNQPMDKWIRTLFIEPIFFLCLSQSLWTYSYIIGIVPNIEQFHIHTQTICRNERALHAFVHIEIFICQGKEKQLIEFGMFMVS